MKTRTETLGFMVVEKAEEWEQPLCLDRSGKDPRVPAAGALDWIDKGQAAHVFHSRQEARAAIRRSEALCVAHGEEAWPRSQFCKIVKVQRDVPVAEGESP